MLDNPSNPLLSERALMISSDGHATAQMDDYRDYLPSSHHEEFDAFCAVFREHGSRNFDLESMREHLDPEVTDDWKERVIDADRLRGVSNAGARLEEMGRNGIAAEVLFPDFGLPFELYGAIVSAMRGVRRTPDQVAVANAAYNRWLADFCSEAPDRLSGLAVLGFEDTDAAVAEIRWAKEAGLRGVVLPTFSEAHPIFHPRFDRIWSTVVELGMPVNSHVVLSGVAEYAPVLPPLPHPSVARPIFTEMIFHLCHQILHQLIWGGVLERHPDLQVVFTEQGSGWVVGALESMDYKWEGSYVRRDIRSVVKRRPSEYFTRQCHLGSSLFSLAEARAREDIGVDKMTIGVDYPHHEGTWGAGPGHLEYLQATLGAARVSPEDARRMVGENSIDLYGFDRIKLRAVADAIGPTYAQILTIPTSDEFPRGDVHRPLGNS